MFENIVGHEKQKDILTRSLASGNISHAYLFFGNSGIGKYALAKEFAKEILANVELIYFAESLGGTETLITYPITQTHADVPKDVLEKKF